MAAAMTSCRGWGGVESGALRQIRGGNGRRLVSCNRRAVGAESVGDRWLGIGRGKKGESVSVMAVCELFKRQFAAASRLDSRPSHLRQLASPKNVFSEDFSKDFCSTGDGEVGVSGGTIVGFLALPALVGFTGAANASTLEANMAYGEIGQGLEFGVQLIYLGALLALLGVGSFLVVRQVLVRRELENAAKDLQDRVRTGEASSEEFFELGAVMLRKKFYLLANKYLEQAIKKWDGDEADLAQVYNALGFSYFSDDKLDAAISQYEKAVKLQPGYVTAWNNLGNAFEMKKDFKQALKSYEEALQFDPSNKIAQRQRDFLKERVDRFQGIPSKD